VIGETRGHLGQSALLWEAFGRAEGDAPPVDLEAERRNGDFLLANRALVTAATDLSDGGLALAAFEMAEAAGLGSRSTPADIATSSARIRRATSSPAPSIRPRR
jgi:phosphoribosylformylglycinamidine synthase subunit PurL